MVLAADADPERAQLVRDQQISVFLLGGHEFSRAGGQSSRAQTFPDSQV